MSVSARKGRMRFGDSKLWNFLKCTNVTSFISIESGFPIFKQKHSPLPMKATLIPLFPEFITANVHSSQKIFNSHDNDTRNWSKVQCIW